MFYWIHVIYRDIGTPSTSVTTPSMVLITKDATSTSVTTMNDTFINPAEPLQEILGGGGLQKELSYN